MIGCFLGDQISLWESNVIVATFLQHILGEMFSEMFLFFERTIVCAIAPCCSLSLVPVMAAMVETRTMFLTWEEYCWPRLRERVGKVQRNGKLIKKQEEGSLSLYSGLGPCGDLQVKPQLLILPKISTSLLGKNTDDSPTNDQFSLKVQHLQGNCRVCVFHPIMHGHKWGLPWFLVYWHRNVAWACIM